MHRLLSLACLLFFAAALPLVPLAAQQTVRGRVVDDATGEPLAMAVVIDAGKRLAYTADDGSFSLPAGRRSLRISLVGYRTATVSLARPPAGDLTIRLKPLAEQLGEAVVSGRRTKYSRKDNPAVEFMRRVIAAKRRSELTENDFYSLERYTKYFFALNNVTDKVFEEERFKRFPFLKDHVERLEETGRLVLPFLVDESVTRHIYRREPETRKQIVLGQRTSGLNEVLNTGDLVNGMLKDCFSEINIYDDEVRLLQHPFLSPIAAKGALAFYRYFLVDTLDVGARRCVRVDFTPNNPQDFGFSGSLYVAADSTLDIERAELSIPRRSDVNFVERMRITQTFSTLPDGHRVLTGDDMLIELALVGQTGQMVVKRTSEDRNFSFAPIADRAFAFRGPTTTEPYALMRDEAYWEQQRPAPLGSSERGMSSLVRKFLDVKGMKAVVWVAKAFIENHVEASFSPDRPAKVDIGPINTIITSNFIDGLRLRASAQTTAHLHKHLFVRGYAAYGFGDHRWKGMGEVTWAFNEKAYLPREFPVRNLTFQAACDVMAASDKFLLTDKDNVFTALKWTKVEHMNYYRRFLLTYDHEWENGLRLTTRLRHERDEACGLLFYLPMSGATIPEAAWVDARKARYFDTADFSVTLVYRPGTTWVNTKQRRYPTNYDHPVYTLSHTVGLGGAAVGQGLPASGLRGRNLYNLTEASLYKRFWLGSWGKIDAKVQGGVEWNKVPFPLLFMPAANLSYVIQTDMFGLIGNMEFPTDRYASLMLSWDANGKLFNRIPLLRKLKWREFFACNVLWGMLSDRNNPTLERHASDSRLLYFPGSFAQGGAFRPLCRVMEPRRPYVEVVAGVHNIFKLLHIEYVRRLTYIDDPETRRGGVRLMLRITF